MSIYIRYIKKTLLSLACLWMIGGYVWGQEDGFDPMTQRKALVGEGCMINQIGQDVALLNSYENLEAVTDESLTNYATIGGVNVGVGVRPLLSVKDTRNFYGPGTKAGFSIVSEGGGLLGVDLVNMFTIVAYGEDENGNPVQKSYVVENVGSGVSLDLLKIPGTDAVSIDLEVTPDIRFNELFLMVGGVEISALEEIGIKYAFVGESKEYPLTYRGMSELDNSINFDGCESMPWPEKNGPLGLREDNMDEVILDYDLTDKLSTGGIAIGEWCHMHIAVNNDFEAGTEVGFKYSSAGLLNLSLGGFTTIALYRDGKEVQSERIEASVLGVGVAKSDETKTSIIADVPFDAVRLTIGAGVLAVDLGEAAGIYYGYIKKKPIVNHHCEINPSLSAELCNGETAYQLMSDIPVKWEVVEPEVGDAKPDGGTFSEDDIPDLEPVMTKTQTVENTTIVNVTGLTVNNYDYVFKATASDGCSDLITLHKGLNGVDLNSTCGQPVVNVPGETPKYAISDENHESEGSLLSISDMDYKDRIVDGDADNYATYTGGLAVANDLGLIGVKTVDGSCFEEMVSVDKARRVGFIVEDKSTLLSANVLQFYQIRLYKNGKRITEGVPRVIDESNIVGVGLIGNEQAQKVRYSIEVPAGVEFDEFQLWKSGILDLDLSTLRIYYGFIEDADENCSDPLSSSCAEAISSTADDMHVTVIPYMPFSLASVAVVVTDIANLVDDDYTTAMKVVQTVNAASEIAFSIKLGRVIDNRQQVGLVTDNITYLAGVDALSQLSIETYRNGSPTGEKFSNWTTVGLNLIGFGDKNYLIASPTLPYDEIRVTIGGLASVLDGINFYGLFFRSDIDGDGLPDCLDTTPCPGELSGLAVTKDLCQGDFLHLTGLGSLDAGDKEDTYAVYLVYQAAVTSSNPKDDVLLGEIKITSENLLIDENYQISVEPDEEYSIKLVRTNLTAGEEERTYDVGMTFTVHPREATWKGGTSGKETDWNEWGNWSDGAPWTCTNVIIPTNGDNNQPIENYPILTKDVQNPCNYIHFEPHAEVVNTPYLTYQKAWVEIALQPDRYYMVSAPLKNIFSGDWFYPRVTMDASTSITVDEAQKAIDAAFNKTTHPYFTALTEQTMPANRVTPTIYQRVWERTVVNKLASGGQAGVYPTYAGTSWTAPYNWLSTSYEKQEKTNYASNALSVWVHPFSATDEDEENPAPTGNDKKLFYTFRFPKEHTTYFYTNEKGEPLSYSANLTREHVGRFIYEDEESNASFPIKMVYKNEGTDNNVFLVGNPFMSHIDVAEFFDGNPSITSIKVYDGDAYNSIIDLKDEGLLSATRDENDVDDISSIAPMQSFFVETDGTSDLPEICEITYTEDMLEQNPNPDKEDGYLKSAHAATDEDRIYLTAMAAGKESSAVLRFSASASDYFRSGEDADILIDDEVPPAVAVFTVAGERAVDIQQRVNGGEIPLGFFLAKPEEVTLRLTVPRAYEGWLLNDAETGKSYPLRAGTNEFPLGRMLTNVGRFSLHGDSPTGNETITASQPRVYCFREEGNMLVVRSEAGMMARCEVYAPSGQLSGMARYETNEYRLPVAPGAKIVRVYFTDGVTSTIKTF